MTHIRLKESFDDVLEVVTDGLHAEGSPDEIQVEEFNDLINAIACLSVEEVFRIIQFTGIDEALSSEKALSNIFGFVYRCSISAAFEKETCVQSNPWFALSENMTKHANISPLPSGSFLQKAWRKFNRHEIIPTYCYISSNKFKIDVNIASNISFDDECTNLEQTSYQELCAIEHISMRGMDDRSHKPKKRTKMSAVRGSGKVFKISGGSSL